ncbi:MAG: diguanylate cyclase [Gallionella sp.]|nr:diguanylate cyclase [Gallionella sp.]
MSTSGKLISEYRIAIQSLRDGKYDVAFPADENDEIGKLGHDLNELARALERRFDEAARVCEISEEITAGLFLDDVLNRLYDSFRKIIPYNRIGCALLNNEKNEAVAYWTKTDAPQVLLKAGFTASITGSSLWQIIETGQPRILNDLETYLAEHPASVTTRLIVEEGMRSSLTWPLIAQGKPVGLLFFSSREKNAYQNVHQDIFLKIAGQISLLVEKSRLYQQMSELNGELILAQRELRHQATHDALTGIYNRRAITELLEAQLARARRHNQPLAVVMLDVDLFKQFNDTYGHHAGDAVLKAVSTRMKESLREYDYIGRYGGEEFLVVLGDAGYDMAAETAERLCRAVRDEAVVFDGKPLDVTISAGVAVAENPTGLDPDKIISAADKELYTAKSNGRNRVEVCRI